MAPPVYHGPDKDSWKALVSAFLELFITCIVLLTATISLFTKKLIKYFELPHPCTYLGLHHERTPFLCEHHRRLANLNLHVQNSCVECLLEAEHSSGVVELFESSEVKKLIPGEQSRNEVGLLNGKVGEENGQQERKSKVPIRLGSAGDRCVKRKFAKVFAEESKEHLSDQQESLTDGKTQDAGLRPTEEVKNEESNRIHSSEGDDSSGADFATKQEDGRSDISVESVKAAFQAEKDALGSLYAELEEERNASAIAANEAMAMITRLQEEKAAVQMEARQYQRMVEEKADYDQEAITLLKEILLRREQEKFVLEREVESYRKRLLNSRRRQDWDLDDDADAFDRFQLPVSFDNDDVLLLEGTEKDKVFRGVNLLHDFELASGQNGGDHSHQSEETFPGLENGINKEQLNSIWEDEDYLRPRNGGLNGDNGAYFDMDLRATSPGTENGTDTNMNIPGTENGVDTHIPGTSSTESGGTEYRNRMEMNKMSNDTRTDVDLRTNSMVIRDNFRLAMEEDIRELTDRLQALEDDRQLMKQVMQSMKAEKQELRELVQHLRDLRPNNSDERASQGASVSSKKRRVEIS